MNAFVSQLLLTYARPVTLALVHSLWFGSLISIVAGLALAAVPRDRSNARYAVCMFALAALFVGTAAIGIRVATTPVPSVISQVTWEESISGDTTAEENAPVAATAQASAGVLEEPAASSPAVPDLEPGAQPSATGAQGEDDRWSMRLLHLDLGHAGPWVFMGWLAGVLVLAFYNGVGWMRARSVAHHGIEPLTTRWARRFGDLSTRLGLSQSIDAFASALVDVPTVVGWLRPVLLIPAASFSDLSDGELELVLIHELAHIKRHDILINYLQTAVETLFFFHPAVWWLSHHARVEREHCCDDAVVQLTGDRVAYARALTEVEMMRSRVPSLAMGADGGSLTARIRRLAGRAGSPGRTSRYPLTGFLVLAALAALAIPTLSGIESDANAGTLDSTSEATMRGEWRSKGFGDQLRLRFTIEHHGDTDRTSSCDMGMNAEEFTETASGELTLVRDAGTFVLEGARFPEKWRPCSFIPNRSYAAKLREFGYDIEEHEEDRLFELAVHDVSLDFARGIAEAGYEISLSQLVEFDIHGVTPEYVADMAAAGYDDLTPSGIVEFRIHGVSAEYVRDMAATGCDDLSQSKIVQFRIHGVSPEYVKAMGAIGYDEMTPSKIIEFRIHGVSPEYVREMAATGYTELSPSRIIEFRIHGVTPEYVKAMEAIGYDEMSPSKIIEFRIHGVTPEYVRDMAASGYTNVSASKIIEFRIHGVTPEFVRDLVKIGYDDLTASKLVEFRIHGVDAEFIERLRDDGYEDLTPGRIVELKIHGVHRGSRHSSRSSRDA